MTSTLTARTPEDLFAVARVVLGFEPDHSVVMLTFGARHPFHARVDLPEGPVDAPELDDLAEVLARPALEHGVGAVVLLLFTDDDRLARRVARRVGRRLALAGVDCLEALRTHDGRWHPLTGRFRGVGSAGVPYDVSAHPFLARAVLEGRVLHGSRAELAATLAVDPDAVLRVTATRPTPRGAPDWVAATVARLAAGGTAPGPAEAARLLESIAVPEGRDAAWGGARRDDARRHVELWSGLVRSCPDDLVPHAAAVLAVVAWLAGDGALAWCGVERAREHDPTHPLAGLVADLLEAAVPPSCWEERGPAS